jgi:hypothetical protein
MKNKEVTAPKIFHNTPGMLAANLDVSQNNCGHNNLLKW